MDIIVFSDREDILDCFKKIKKGHTFSRIPYADMKKVISGGNSDFVYVDVSGQSDSAVRSVQKYLSRQENLFYGVLDPEGIIKDTASLFFAGASDYIGSDCFQAGITAKRLQAALSFNNEDAALSQGTAQRSQTYLYSGTGWDTVKPGKEYTFVMMYIELDNKEEFRKMGTKYAAVVLERFQQYLSDMVSPCCGRIWMWMDFGGVVLFPFDGRQSSAVIPAFKLMFDNRIASSEVFNLDFLLSYRIVMLIGNTTYKGRGDTGAIVSDSLNTIFHLGKKYARPGNFYMTKKMYSHIPKGFGHFFIPRDEYEGKEMMKMMSLK